MWGNVDGGLRGGSFDRYVVGIKFPPIGVPSPFVVSMRAVVLLAVAALAVVAKESAWSEWTAWNGDCAPGSPTVKTRFRICIPPEDGSNPICQGKSSEIIACAGCPANGTWSEWGLLDGCSAPCGACGRRYRSRDCKQTAGCTPVPCDGPAKQMEKSEKPCDTLNICMFPFRPCCEGYHYIIDREEGRAKCVPGGDQTHDKNE